jgi:multisubunit Na+/H+ antiporter MnhB subunit
MRNLIVTSVLVVLAATMLFVAANEERPFGAPRHSEMDDYFIRNGQRDTATNNIVTAVVFDFRALDTLGEATVLFVAVLGVGLVFRGAMREDKEDSA